jgi:hypothetical protein
MNNWIKVEIEIKWGIKVIMLIIGLQHIKTHQIKSWNKLER